MRVCLLVLVAACSETVEMPSQVIHVDVQAPDCGSDCYTAIGLYGICGPDVGYIGTESTSVNAVSDEDAHKLTGIIEFQYTGSVVTSGKPYLAYVLGPTTGTLADAYAAGDAALLYQIDLQQGVINLDKTRLVDASGPTMTFQYNGWTETHTVDKPRPISVEVDSDWVGCCSTAHPTTGALWLVAIMQILARRRCRQARPPRR